MKRSRSTGSSRQRLTAFARLFALALLVGSALLSPYFAVPAAASSYGYTWEIKFDFDAGFVQSVVPTEIEDVVWLALKKNEMPIQAAEG